MLHPEELEYREPYKGTVPHGDGERRVSSWEVARKGSGVYVIKEDGVIVYVGVSKSALRLTAYRHFQSWVDPRQRRVTYKWNLHEHNYTIAILEMPFEQAMHIEEFWIVLCEPRDNWARLEHLRKPKEEPLETYERDDRDYPF